MKIGDKVKIKDFEQLPERLQDIKHKGLAGKEAEILDSLDSEAQGCRLYRVRLTGAGTIPAALLPEEALEPADDAVYSHVIEYLDNLVLVRFYEIKGDQTREIGRGHGHIIHAGALGIAQATSYAMRRVYEQIAER